MKECFEPDNKFKPESAARIVQCNAIITDYTAQGYDLSLRQLYYQLVSRNIIENKEREYKNLANLISEARYAGLVDWDAIKDRGRETLCNPHWGTPADFLRVVSPQYRFDLWQRQPNYVEVMVEKQALEGVLEPVCKDLDVSFTANKGYSSSSALYETSKRYLGALEAGKELHVIYLGDHDPSGIDMSRDVEDRLNQFVNVSSTGAFDDKPDHITMHRVALNLDQIKKLKPPENPAKLTDSRAPEYIARFGTDKSWELDAIEPKALAKLVTDAVTGLMDKKLMDEDKAKMAEGREALEAFADQYEEGT